MIKVTQTVFGYPDGNCFAACVASIMELPLEEMPSIAGREFNQVWSQWLAERDLAFALVPSDGAWIKGYCIAWGNSPRGGLDKFDRPVTHAVVCRDLHLVHDPHPSGEFLDGAVQGYFILYRLWMNGKVSA